MRHLVIASVLTCVACSPQIVNKPVSVDTPVAVTCHVPQIQAPKWATEGISPSNTLFEQGRALLATDQQRRAYEASLAAANEACK